MGRIIKTILVLAIAAFLALVAYSLVGDFEPEQVPVTKPVKLDGS